MISCVGCHLRVLMCRRRALYLFDFDGHKLEVYGHTYQKVFDGGPLLLLDVSEAQLPKQ